MIDTLDASRITEETGVTAEEAGPQDAVLGIVPKAVAYPKSVEDVSRVLAWANKNGLKVVPCGSRTKLDRGNAPSACDLLLDLSGLAGVIEHAAGDMTVRVMAGTRLEDLQARLGAQGQSLAIDPPVPGTVGGLIATADSGPRRLRYGGVRDLILGVTFVRTDGTVARGGGKVVKNVAGYDLPKLMTGALGTLGVIVEANFRLYPVPPASMTVACECSIEEASTLAERVMAAGLVPTGADYRTGDTPANGILAVRFETSPVAAEEQSKTAEALLSSAGVRTWRMEKRAEAALWDEFGGVVRTDEGDVLGRLTTTIHDLPRLVSSAREAANLAGVWFEARAHVRHGQAVLCWRGVKADNVLPLLRLARKEAEARGSSLVVWRAPGEVRAQFDAWGDPGEGIGLMRRVKAQFDPNNTLNPGRFVGGI